MRTTSYARAKNRLNLTYCNQKTRNRLFRSWFGIYGENAGYLYLPMVVFDDEDNENYAALILRKDHPRFKDVVSEFTSTINMLNNKPESI